MSDSTLYDDDILLWSEQQAAAIRRLAAVRNLPNELDIENVAEEIESVGRSELASVESLIEQMFVHLIKLFLQVDTQSEGHWRAEIVAFHFRMRRRYSPSMRQRISLDDIWRVAREQSLLTYEGVQQDAVAQLSRKSPFALDDLLAESLDSDQLLRRLRSPPMSGEN